MTKYFGCHSKLEGLLVALIFASMIIYCKCRLAALEEDENLQMKSVLELSSRDEVVLMAGYGEEKLSTVLITGTVLCNTDCLAASESEHVLLQQPIAGALVGTTCHTSSKDKKGTLATAVSDEYGEFMIDLPSHLHAIPELDKACSVRVLKLPKKSACHQPSFTRGKKEIKLSSLGNGVRTYTAETIAFPNKTFKNFEACIKGVENEVGMSWQRTST